MKEQIDDIREFGSLGLGENFQNVMICSCIIVSMMSSNPIRSD